MLTECGIGSEFYSKFTSLGKSTLAPSLKSTTLKILHPRAPTMALKLLVPAHLTTNTRFSTEYCMYYLDKRIENYYENSVQ